MEVKPTASEHTSRANTGARDLPLLFRRFTLRHWRTSPGQTAILVVILALGVAVFVSVRLANRAAVSSFSHFTETLIGQSDGTLQAHAGMLAESVLPELRRELGVLPVHLIPVLETTANVLERSPAGTVTSRRSCTVLGVDLIALANIARDENPTFFSPPPDRQSAQNDRAPDFWATVEGSPKVWISRMFASSLPESVSVTFDERQIDLPVAGFIPQAVGAPAPPANLLIVDLLQLQRVLEKPGQISRVEFLVERGSRADEVREKTVTLLQALGAKEGGWSVDKPGTSRETAETMTRAFRLNLTILSLIALLVGLYLIFQGLDGAVVRRRSEIAVLRSLGVEARTIRLAWLVESTLLGLCGGLVGLLLGWGGAQLSVRAVGQTVNVLYYTSTVASAHLSLAEAGIALGVGIIASIVAGVWPAHLASQTPPAQLLHRGGAFRPGNRTRHLIFGASVLMLGVVLAQLPAYPIRGGIRFPIAGYVTALAWIVGAGWICAYLLPPFSHGARALGAASPSVRLALSHTRHPSGRHRLAVAALLCAIGMTAGMAILVASFELTVRGWIERTLQADLYLSSRGAAGASAQNRISSAARSSIGTHPSVEKSSALASFPIIYQGLPTTLAGTDLAFWRKFVDQPWVTAPRSEDVFNADQNVALAVVSESFSERFSKRVGDSLDLPTPAGIRRVIIEGIFADYGNERGSALVDQRHLREWFGDDSITHLSLYLRPGTDPASLRSELQATFPGLSILANTTLRTEILRVFRQTFAITYALEAIGVIVALVGLALTLASVLLDRKDELTTLRALGFTQREIASATAVEGFALSLCAATGGLLLSAALGWLLIYVINKQSFGWTLGFALPWGQLALLAGGICLTGAVVSYGVGRWSSQLPADREE